MNYNDLLSCEGMTGSLFALKGGREVTVEYIEFTSRSIEKIINAIRYNGQVRGEDQLVDIKEIRILKSDRSTFMEGQSSVVKNGNTYSVTSSPASPLKFRGVFKALFVDSTNHGQTTVCEIELGSISFDVKNSRTETDDEYISFYNVEAILFPRTNHYKADKIDSES